MCKSKLFAIVLLIAGSFALYQPAHAQSRSSTLRVTGTVVGISGRASARIRQFTLIVNRYTSQAEVDELNAALQRGEEEMLRVLSRMNVGRIQIGTGVGVRANAIIAVPWENGTRVTVLYERDINFYELRYGRRSADYRFGYAEMFLNRDGKGEGTFFAAARVNLRNGNTWEVEDFGVFPARLMGLRSSGRVMPN